MPHRGAQRLYDILDTLVALQLEYASGTEGESAISALGPAKVLEVRTALDTAIYGVRRALENLERARPTTDPAPDILPGGHIDQSGALPS